MDALEAGIADEAVEALDAAWRVHAGAAAKRIVAVPAEGSCGTKSDIAFNEGAAPGLRGVDITAQARPVPDGRRHERRQQQ